MTYESELPSHSSLQQGEVCSDSSLNDENVQTIQNLSFLKRHYHKLILSGFLTICLVYVLQKGGFQIWPDPSCFHQVRWWTLIAYLALLTVMNYFRAIRWRYLLRPLVHLPLRRILSVSYIGFAATILFPFRIGEMVRPLLIRSKGNVSITAATATVLAERIADGLCLSLVLAVALLLVPTLHPLPEHVVGFPVSVAYVRESGFLMLAIFAVAFTALAVFYFLNEWAQSTTHRVFSWLSPTLGHKISGVAAKLASGLHCFRRVEDVLPFLLETTCYWGLNALGMWLLGWGCGIMHEDGTPIMFGESCALMGMLGVTVLIPGPPGLLGVFQAGIYAGMTMYFPVSMITQAGAAYVFLLYATQVGWQIVAATICLLRRNSYLAI
ncbi:hypothetical protein BCY86_04770 [Pajaroellobacter abortibovis]|uniref:TIGR00374 family protein n=2 Tax=Pajaroellobacter abortibovis TaxID=1882918 RepID=A0A1L6MXF3_9BACT|nr:hypothetical protein BCY86_04770 [Pajaroellobacter abortibovis]